MFRKIWLRKFYSRISGAGKGSDINLADVRFKDEQLSQEREKELIRAHEAETEQLAHYDVHVDSLPRNLEGRSHRPTSGSNQPEDLRLDNSRSLTSIPGGKSNRDHPNSASEMAVHATFPQQHKNVERNLVERSPVPIGASTNIWDTSSHLVVPHDREQSSGYVEEQWAQLDQMSTSTVPPMRFHDPLPSARGPTQQSPERSNRYNVNAKDTAPDKGKTTTRKRKRRGTSLSLTAAALHMDGGRQGLCYHLAKCCSISRTTIASRLSSTLSLPRIRTASSEFKQYYARPGSGYGVQASSSARGVLTDSTSTQYVNEPITEALAVGLLMKAWAQDSPDGEVGSQLAAMLPERIDERNTFVNASDGRGVSPLHLAVAYGYPETCALLLDNNANPDAKTLKGTSVYRFAMPAARLAGERLTLYVRILVCRMFVREGKPPPAPKRNSLETRDVSRQLKGYRRKRRNGNDSAQEIQTDAGPTRGAHDAKAFWPSTSTGMAPARSTTTGSSVVGSQYDTGVPPHSFAFNGLDPWYTSRFTDSPVPDSFLRINSLPMNSAAETAFSDIMSRHTAAPGTEISAHQSDPSLPYFGASPFTVTPVVCPTTSQTRTRAGYAMTTSLQSPYGLSDNVLFPSGVDTAPRPTELLANSGIDIAYIPSSTGINASTMMQQVPGAAGAHTDVEQLSGLLHSDGRHAMPRRPQQWPLSDDRHNMHYASHVGGLSFPGNQATPSLHTFGSTTNTHLYHNQLPSQYRRNHYTELPDQAGTQSLESSADLESYHPPAGPSSSASSKEYTSLFHSDRPSTSQSRWFSCSHNRPRNHL